MFTYNENLPLLCKKEGKGAKFSLPETYNYYQGIDDLNIFAVNESMWWRNFVKIYCTNPNACKGTDIKLTLTYSKAITNYKDPKGLSYITETIERNLD